MLSPPQSSSLDEDVSFSAVASLTQVCGRCGCGSSWQNVVVVLDIHHVEPPRTVQMSRVQLQALDTSPQICGDWGVEIRVIFKNVDVLWCTISD